MTLAQPWIVLLFSIPIGMFAALHPDWAQGVSLALFWGSILAVSLYRVGKARADDRWLAGAVTGGLLVRFPMVLAHLAVGFWVFGGQLDFPGYFTVGVEVGRKLFEGDLMALLRFGERNPGEFGRQVVIRLTSLSYLLVGPSLVGVFLISGAVGFLGSYFFLRAFQTEFSVGPRQLRFLAMTLFFFPSLAFWTSLLGKDSWMFFFLGLTTYLVARLMKAFRPRYVLGVVLGIVFISLIRAPIGAALSLAVGGCLILALHSRLDLRGPIAILRPVAYVSIVGIAVAAVLFSPLRRYQSFEETSSFSEGLLTLAFQKHVGLSTDPTAGGSSLAASIEEPTASAALRYLPQGVFTFLFRPFVFEAHNKVALIAALDATLLMIVTLARLRWLARGLRESFRNPFLGFCAMAFLLLSVGLSFESNFGAIVRHRAMVVPFLFILLAVPRTAPPASSSSSRP